MPIHARILCKPSHACCAHVCPAARLTVKELQSLQAQLKAQIDYVIGDKELGIGDELASPGSSSGAAAGHATGAAGGSAGMAGGQRRRELPEQLGAPWGLDSIDQSSLPLDGKYNYDNMGGLCERVEELHNEAGAAGLVRERAVCWLEPWPAARPHAPFPCNQARASTCMF